MLGEKQIKEKVLKVTKCVELFLQIEGITQMGVSKLSGIPQSSVDRYLKDYDTIKWIYGVKAPETIKKIQTKLKNNKQTGTVKGGIISQCVSPYVKNEETGKFEGSKKAR